MQQRIPKNRLYKMNRTNQGEDTENQVKEKKRVHRRKHDQNA